MTSTPVTSRKTLFLDSGNGSLISTTDETSTNIGDSFNNSIRDISIKCDALCRESNGSLLYGPTYQQLESFDPKEIWNEMIVNVPQAIAVFDAISGKDSDNEGIQLKYVFIYSILMMLRWSKLSIFQRVLTSLMIEGGCSKMVIGLHVFSLQA